MRRAVFVVSAALLLLAAATFIWTFSRAPGRTFRDCPQCPEMTVIPAGAFLMGSPASEAGRTNSEGPRHRVEVSSFAASVFPITRGEYAKYVQETGHSVPKGCLVWTGKPFDQPDATRNDPQKNWRDPGFGQTDRDPVVCVSWNDAQAYISWLNSRQSRQGARLGPYRLLSEAEWEYAARAGTDSPYFWGPTISHSNANYGIDQCPPCAPRVDGADRWAHTSPVGSFPPNPFGLYDMAGNVFQMVQDCLHDDYAGAPTDGSAWETGNCKFHIGRGGDWIDSPQFLRAAYRDLGAADDRDQFSGFRVARTLRVPR